MRLANIILAATVLLASGCSGGEDPEEGTLEVTPKSITFSGSTFQFDKVTIRTGRYPVQVIGENTQWLETENLPTTVEANSTCTFHLRPKEYSLSDRKCVYHVVETTTSNTVNVTVTQKAYDKGSGFRLGSYNLWIASGRNKAGSPYEWSNSKTALTKSIVADAFDIFGFQEADPSTMQKELPGLVASAGGKYSWKFFGRDSQDATKGEAIGIAYNPDKFTVSDFHYFWLSPTPETMSYGWDETSYHRMACTAVVTELRSGKKFFLMVTHAPLGSEANANSGNVLVTYEKKYNTQNLTSILVGDMNATSSDPLSTTLRTHWSDIYKSTSASQHSGSTGTFHSHGTHEEYLTQEKHRIDYIYVREGASGYTVSSYRADATKYASSDGTKIFPSDHCPIMMDVRLK